MCFRNATLCLNERQLMLQGHFHPILLIVSRRQRCPLVQHVLFPKGGWDALSKRSRISWNVRRAGSGHLIFLKLSALSFSVLHTPFLSSSFGGSYTCGALSLVSRSRSVPWGHLAFHSSVCFCFFQALIFFFWLRVCFSFLPSQLPSSLPPFLSFSFCLPSILTSFLPPPLLSFSLKCHWLTTLCQILLYSKAT